MTVLYEVGGKKYKVEKAKPISMKNKIWNRDIIKIDNEEYTKYYKGMKDRKSNTRNYIYIEYGDEWYKIEQNRNTIFMEDELYTSQYYKNNIK